MPDNSIQIKKKIDGVETDVYPVTSANLVYDKDGVTTVQTKIDELNANLADSLSITDGDETANIRFGVDADGNYGYYKVGADSVTPFKSGEDLDCIALPYDEEKEWTVNDTCIYEGLLYKCNEDTTGEFDSSKWDRIYLDELSPIVPSISPSEDIDWIALQYDPNTEYNTDDLCWKNDAIYKCLEDGVTGEWDTSKWEQTYLADISAGTETVDDNTVIVEALQNKISGEFDELPTTANNDEIANAILNSNLNSNIKNAIVKKQNIQLSSPSSISLDVPKGKYCLGDVQAGTDHGLDGSSSTSYYVRFKSTENIETIQSFYCRNRLYFFIKNNNDRDTVILESNDFIANAVYYIF